MKTYTEKQLAIKLPTPKEIRQLLKTYNHRAYGMYRTQFFSTMQFFRGKWWRRVWALTDKYASNKYCEIYRVTEGKGYLENHRLRYHYIAGYSVNWSDQDSLQYHPFECDLGIGCESLFNREDLVKKDASLKYSAIDHPNNDIAVMEYIKLYREHPEIEILVKEGLQTIVVDKRLFKLHPAKLKAIVSWWKIHKNEVKSDDYINLNFILGAIKRNFNVAQMKEWQRVSKFISQFKDDDLNFARSVYKEMLQYCEKNRISEWLYHDYLRQLKFFDMPLTDRTLLFPKNVVAKHDELSLLEKKEKYRKINKQLTEIADKYNTLEGNYGDFRIIIPRTQQEFFNQGNALHQCVGTAGYSSDMAKGDCLIVFIFKDNQPIETCELIFTLKDNLKIEQLRGDHNQDSDCHSEVRKAVEQFIKKHKKLYVNPKTTSSPMVMQSA